MSAAACADRGAPSTCTCNAGFSGRPHAAPQPRGVWRQAPAPQLRRFPHMSVAGRGQASCCAVSTSDGQRSAAAAEPATPNESPTERRLRESQRVEERVTYIYDKADWDREVAEAGDELVVLEVESQELCQTGFEEEAELQWKEDREASLRPCREIKHVFARTARDCPEVTFLALEADAEEAQPLLDELNIEVLPTVQFWKQGKLLWEHRGIVALQQDLGEGVLYYGDSGADGLKASTFVTELSTRADLDAFVTAQPANVLTVVDVSLRSATPCVRIFPAVMALAKNMQGFASFARLVGDSSAEMQGVLRELNILEVPTFLFYREGKEIGRVVSSSRADLIGHILQLQNAMGIAPPPVQRPAKKIRQRQQRPKRNAWGSSA